MEAYKKTIRRRLVLQVVLLALAVLLVALAGVLSYHISRTNPEDFLRGFNMGVPVGLMLVFCVLSVIQILHYRRALRNDEVLRELQVKEQDERERLIRDKIGGFGFDFSMGMVLVGGVACSFFNTVASFTLFCALSAMALVKAGLKGYYYRKY